MTLEMPNEIYEGDVFRVETDYYDDNGESGYVEIKAIRLVKSVDNDRVWEFVVTNRTDCNYDIGEKCHVFESVILETAEVIELVSREIKVKFSTEVY